MYLHLRKYPTFSHFEFLNFLLRVTFLLKTVIYSGWNFDVKSSSSILMGVDSTNTCYTQRSKVEQVHYCFEAKHIYSKFRYCTLMYESLYEMRQMQFTKQPNLHTNGLQDHKGHSDAHPTDLSFTAIIHITQFPVKQCSLFNGFQGTQRKSDWFSISHLNVKAASGS